MHPPDLLAVILQEIGTVESEAPADEWIPQMMARGTSRQQEVRVTQDWEQLLEGEDDDEEVAGTGEDTEAGGEVTGLEEEVVDAHPSGGAAKLPPNLQLSQVVQQALTHSHRVLEGKAPSVHAQPPPQIPVAPGVSGACRALSALEQQQIKEAAAKAYREGRSRRRSRGPQLATPRPPATNTTPTTPAGTHGASRVPVPPAPTAPGLPPQKHLYDVPENQRGKWWKDRWNKPFTSWGATNSQLWEAHCLLTGKNQWATPKATYLSSVPAKGAPSMRYLCGEPSCQHRSASVLDARDHHQATHIKLTSSPLCSCRNNTFFNAATLANHLDMQHNVHPGAVMRDPPSALLMFLDRRCAPHVGQGATIAVPLLAKGPKRVKPPHLLTRSCYIFFHLYLL